VLNSSFEEITLAYPHPAGSQTPQLFKDNPTDLR
jgi:hypothetical protein